MKPIALLFVALFLAAPASAHEEMLGRISEFQKTYLTTAPFNTIRVTFSMPKDAPVIRIETDTCKIDVPQHYLLDLPRPDFESLTLPHSATSYDPQVNKWVDRGYLSVRIPLHGPAGQAWTGTWALLHFDQDGTFKHRRLVRFVPTPDGATQVLHTDWPADKNLDPAKLLQNAAIKAVTR